MSVVASLPWQIQKVIFNNTTNTYFWLALKGRCYGNRFLSRIGENWHISPSFNALAFHTGWKDRNVDARFNTADDPSTCTSDKTLVNFGPATLEFCRRVLLRRAYVFLVLIMYTAVGCSDLVPPSDAWLKRSDNVATVGCYVTRQTWILTCDQSGRWTGTFGNCTQRTISRGFNVLKGCTVTFVGLPIFANFGSVV